MAIPRLYALEDCADFSKAVEPYIPQLYALPARLLDVVAGRENLTTLYQETNPLISGFAISVFLGGIFLVAAEFNRNYSQVDRFWSLLPTAYIAHFNLWASLNGLLTRRLAAPLLFSSIWSARLTYNYWRKGGYEIGSEDYRWELIRQRTPKLLFHILNWTFISFMQSILLFLIAAPVYTVLLASTIEPQLSSADVAYVAISLGLLLTEYIADEQQWAYQSAKKHYQTTASVPRSTPHYTQADLDRGFVTSGLWAYSRHPNFAAEQAIWLALYQWSCYATKTPWHWSAAGPAFLVLLFQGSTWFTESITGGKYPGYRDYQRQVGMFVPKGLGGYRYDAAAAAAEEEDSGVKKATGPKVIRTSEIAKRVEEKERKEREREKEKAKQSKKQK